jgi:hypothetical protein
MDAEGWLKSVYKKRLMKSRVRSIWLNAERRPVDVIPIFTLKMLEYTLISNLKGTSEPR